MGSLFVWVHPWFDRTNDGSVYILTSRSLLRGEGYTYMGEPFSIRAPGLAVMLMPFVGKQEISFYAINLMISCFGVGTALLFYAYNRLRLGWLVAMAASLLLWVQPGFQRLCNQVMSDVPGAFLLLLCLLLERRCSKAKSVRLDVLLGLVVGLSTYVREGLILLVPAILAGRLLANWWPAGDSKEPVGLAGQAAPEVADTSPESADTSFGNFVGRRLAVFAFVAALVVAPWSIRNRVNTIADLPVDQDLHHSVADLLLREDPGDPSSAMVPFSEILERPAARAAESWKALRKLSMTRPLNPASTSSAPAKIHPLNTAFGAAMVLCLLLSLARKRRAAEFFILLHFCSVMLFPTTFLDRYILPIYLIGLGCLLETVTDLTGWLTKGTTGKATQAVALVAVVVMAFACFDPKQNWEAIEKKDLQLRRLCNHVAKRLEPNARLGTVVGWHMSVLMNRPVYSLLYAGMRAGPQVGGEAMIKKYDLDTLVISQLRKNPQEWPSLFQQYFAQNYKGTQQFRAAGRENMLVRVGRKRVP